MIASFVLFLQCSHCRWWYYRAGAPQLGTPGLKNFFEWVEPKLGNPDWERVINAALVRRMRPVRVQRQPPPPPPPPLPEPPAGHSTDPAERDAVSKRVLLKDLPCEICLEGRKVVRAGHAGYECRAGTYFDGVCRRIAICDK